MTKDLEKYFDYLLTEKRYSVLTVDSYRNDLYQFLDYLQIYDIRHWKQVDHLIIRSWIAESIEKGLKKTTVNRKISSLKSFFKYLRKNNIIEHNPCLKIKQIKKPKRNPVFIPEKDIHNIFHNLNPSEQLPFFEFQKYVILELLYATGIRRSELIQLKKSNVLLSEKKIKVLGKRNKERFIPLIDTITNILKKYEAYPEFKSSSCENYFFNSQLQPWSPKQIYTIVKTELSKCTTIEKKSPHVLRHTFATHLLNEGADINAIKNLLGHANLAATQIYTHNSYEKLKNIYKIAHPRSNKKT
ncbi:MAG: integrase [Vicingaceae bacterium]|nr:MAG: integrase [Vicingaceae bacterium]